MKKTTFVSILCTFLTLTGCADSDENDRTAQDLSGTYLFGDISDNIKARLPLEAVTSVADMGLYPSDIDVHGDYAYVVDSGNNAIHRINLDTWAVDKAYIDLGQNAAPFAVHANDKAVYVSCQSSPPAIYRFDLADSLKKTTIFEQAALKAPTDIVTYGDDNPIVLDSEYDYAGMTAAGSVYGKDESDNIYQLKSAAENPVFADILEIDGQSLVAFVTAGVVKWETEPVAPTKSCLEFYDTADKHHTLTQICMPNVSLGRMTMTDSSICVGNGLKPQVHCMPKSSLKTAKTWSDTLLIHDSEIGLTTPVAVGGDTLVVTDFNHDTINWIQNNEVLNLRLSPSEDALKGPIDAVYDIKRKQILVLNSTSGSLDVLRVK